MEPETLDQKVARLEKEITLGVSRTGEPVLPPNVFKWVALALGVLMAALGTLAGFYPDTHAIQVALALAVAVASVLGLASPGIRKVVLLGIVLAPLALSGCTTIQRLGRTAELAAPQVLDCGLEAGKEAFPAMVAEVFGQLMAVVDGGRFDVEPVVDELLAKATNPFMPCVIAAVFQAWAQAGSGAGVDLPVDPVRARTMLLAAHVGQTHLLALGYVCR